MVYIQTIVKCKTGIANIITITYNTPKNKNLEDLKNSLHNALDENLMFSDPNSYCEFLCKRIDAFLHFYSNLEVLSMKVEFSQDDLGKIWLTYATNVYVRHVEMPKQLSNEQGKLTKDQIAQLNAELDDRIQKCIGRPKYEQYSSVMTEIYKKAKEKAEIERVLLAKPISYVNVELMAKLQTKHIWTNQPVSAKNKYCKSPSVNHRNPQRTKERFDLMKSYSKNDEFCPNNFAQRREWIFSTYAASPDNGTRNKSSFSIRLRE